MKGTATLRLLGFSVALPLLLGADPIWPTTGAWNTVNVSGSPYIDQQNDSAANCWAAVDPDTIDLVGGDDGYSGNGTTIFPAAYWYSDGESLMFRVRLDNPFNPLLNNQVFAVLLNTDADPGTDFILQWDAQSEHRIEMNAVNPAPDGEEGPTSTPPWGASNTLDNVVANQIVVGPEAIWGRALDATVIDGSQFHQQTVADHDAFVDFAVPTPQFLSVIGLTAGAPFSVAFGTTNSHATMNKDHPDYTVWSDVISVVPEPGSAALLSLALLPVLLRRRRLAA